MREDTQRQVYIVITVITVLAFALCVGAFLGLEGNGYKKTQAQNSFDTGWVYEDAVNGSQVYHMGDRLSVKTGETVTLTNRLPEHMEETAVLFVESSFNHFSLYVQDTLIYELSQTMQHTFGKEPFPGYYVIPVPVGYAGQRIRLEVASDYSYYSGRIGRLSYGTKGDVLFAFVMTHAAGLVSGLLLLLISLLFFIIKAVVNPKKSQKYEMASLCMLIALAGVYLLADNGIVSLLLGRGQGLYITKFMTVLVIPVYAMHYFMHVIEPRKVRRFAFYAFVISMVDILAALCFVLFGFVDITVYTGISCGCSLTLLLLLSVVMLAGAKRYESDNLTYYGIVNLVFFGFALIAAGCFLTGHSAVGVVLLAIDVLLWVLLLLFSSVNKMVELLHAERLVATNKLDRSRKEVLSELQPDTIFSGFHSLLGLMKRRDPKALKFLVSISDYVRGRFNMLLYEEDKVIPFTEEIKHIEGCLEIGMEKDGAYTYEVEWKVTDFRIPAFSVEAFVENAVRHAVYGPEKPIHIAVRAYETEQAFAVSVADTGRGFHEEDVTAKGEYGIHATVKRLTELVDATVEINSRPKKGTVVTIRFPKNGIVLGEETW